MERERRPMGRRVLPLLSVWALCAALLTAAAAAGTGDGADLFAANITYPVEGGYLYFDAKTGTIEDCDSSVTSAEIPSSIYGVSVTKLGTTAFYGCTDLTSVTIPDSVNSIGPAAFSGCAKLASVRIPDGVKRIDGFGSCTSLAEVMIPETVTDISVAAFYGCTALKDVYYEGTLQDWLDVSIGSSNNELITANIHFESDLSAPPTASVQIASVTILDPSGEPVSAIPTGTFLASVSVTSLSSLDDALVFLAAYSSEGRFLGTQYAFVEASPGATVKVTLPFENALGDIAQIRAIAVTSYDMAPLYGPVSSPAS